MKRFHVDHRNGFKKFFCTNCGKDGHNFKKCLEPITSYGIIGIRIEDLTIEQIYEIFKDAIDEKNPDDIKIRDDCDEMKLQNAIKDLEIFSKWKDKIKFLMITRKNSLGFTEFFGRGTYSLTRPATITKLFEQMSIDELKKISEIEKKVSTGTEQKEDYYSEIWREIWHGSKATDYESEQYQKSKQQFELLCKGSADGVPKLKFYLENITPKYSTPEIVFSGGRRNKTETDTECGIRECEEETGLIFKREKKDIDLRLLTNILPMTEDSVGTNDVKYRRIYFPAIAISNKKPIINLESDIQRTEVGKIMWLSFEDAMFYIRERHTSRKSLILRIFCFVLNRLMKSADIINKETKGEKIKLLA